MWRTGEVGDVQKTKVLNLTEWSLYGVPIYTFFVLLPASCAELTRGLSWNVTPKYR